MREGITTRRFAASRRRAIGFTLVELMIAVLVLVVVIVATSKIFGTVGKVTSLGQATADVLQEVTAIERQIRSDFERLAPNGVFAIRCVSVRNGINVPTGGPLLNPALPIDATIRADQLLFFTNGVAGTQVFAASSGTSRKQQGTAARIYYGHAFQVPGADILTVPVDAPVAFNNGDQLFPWSQDPEPPSLKMTAPFAPGVVLGSIDGTQPLAPQWLLVRQSVLLADDGGGTDFFLSNFANSTATIADPSIRNSRRDIAASQLNDIHTAITIGPGGAFQPWWAQGFGTDQRSVISDEMLFYPRAERVAPSMDRLDHSLTTNVLGAACSSFIVEWTYSNGVGEVRDEFGVVTWNGFQLNPPEREQPWFGLDDADLDGDGTLERGVFTYDSENWWTGAETIIFENIEQYDPLGTVPVRVYEAFFGYNRDRSLDSSGTPNVNLGYTPWPSSIRITMFLHDPDTRLELGREIQFVINLPSRVE